MVLYIYSYIDVAVISVANVVVFTPGVFYTEWYPAGEGGSGGAPGRVLPHYQHGEHQGEC